MVALLAFTGLRLGEVLALRPQEVDVERCAVRVVDGTRIREALIVDPRACQMVVDWIRERDELELPDDAPLFVTLRGRPLSDVYVRQLLARLAASAGMEASANPERLRRALTSELVHRGWGPSAIQRQLGHPTRGATLRYLRRIGIDTALPRATEGLTRMGIVGPDIADVLSCRYCAKAGTGVASVADDAAVLERSADGVLLVDRDWIIEYANETIQSVVGRSRSDLVGVSLWHALPGLAGSDFGQRIAYCMMDAAPGIFAGLNPLSGRSIAARILPSSGSRLSIWIRDPSRAPGFERVATTVFRLALGKRSGRMMVLAPIRIGSSSAPDDLVVDLAMVGTGGGNVQRAAKLIGVRLSETLIEADVSAWLERYREVLATGNVVEADLPCGDLWPNVPESTVRLVPLDAENVAAICVRHGTPV